MFPDYKGMETTGFNKILLISGLMLSYNQVFYRFQVRADIQKMCGSSKISNMQEMIYGQVFKEFQNEQYLVLGRRVSDVSMDSF